MNDRPADSHTTRWPINSVAENLDAQLRALYAENERLRAREAHLLDIIRCYNSDDALFDHEKVVSDVI